MMQIIILLRFFFFLLTYNIFTNCQETQDSSTVAFSYNITVPQNIENDIVISSTPYSNNLSFDNNNPSENNKNIIKIGHIGALNAMPGAEIILEMCRKELWDDGILDETFDVEIINSRACGENYEGLAVAAEMFHLKNVKCFIGPYCGTEMEAVSKMASYWNIPIIGYMAASNIFSDKNIFKTLARVSIRTNNNLAVAVCAMLKHNDWKKVAILTSAGQLAYERLIAFEENFHQENIAVLKKVSFDENADSDSIIRSGIINELSSNARIIICIFSNTKAMSQIFLEAVGKSKLNKNEFVFIFPWLQEENTETLPWIGESGEINQNVKKLFSNTIIVDDVNGFENTLIVPFKEKLSKNSINIEELDMNYLYGYVHLYDSLKLYALVGKELVKENKGNFSVANNGFMVWNKMRRYSFPGLTSNNENTSDLVVMDDLAERVSAYGSFFVSTNKDEIIKIIEMEPIFKENCNGLKTKTGCFEMKVIDLIKDVWPSKDGKFPKDEPDCGFRNEKCNYTLFIVFGVVIILIIFLIISAYFISRFLENKALSKISWRVWRDDIRTLSEEEVHSMLSIGSSKTRLSNLSKFIKHHAVIGTNTHASFHMYPQKNIIQFSREDTILLTQMKQLVHDNLNPFIGISFNENVEMLIFWKYCSRGTIQDIIYNEEVNLDSKFHAAFVRDITSGLEYLHFSPVGYHGSLTPWCCLIDRNWTVKLTDYGVANLIEKWTKQGLVAPEAVRFENQKAAATQKTHVLYCSPEVLKTSEQNFKRGMDQSWIKQSQSRRQAGDIYAFGILMYEILFRKLPFSDKIDLLELVDVVKKDIYAAKPTIQDYNVIHPDLAALLLDCWNPNPDIRPSIRRVKLNTEHYLKVKGSLVDQMLRVMEQYANNLEKLVQERTGMLEEANLRADKLLSQLLPAYVASELKMGKTVPPKLFEEASIMFTDIVGFTKLCSTSTPLEVVNFLNNVYTNFDDIIGKYDAYKVETIGDAYMIVSGVPEENGNRHLPSLADVALDITIFLRDFVIPHRKDQKLQIRLGIHCGQTAAGVIGLTSPRYCLFGDAVNIAHLMESTGLPEKIQVTEMYKESLLKNYPEYNVSLRGTVEIKNIGIINTFWLEGKDEQKLTPPSSLDK